MTIMVGHRSSPVAKLAVTDWFPFIVNLKPRDRPTGPGAAPGGRPRIPRSRRGHEADPTHRPNPTPDLVGYEASSRHGHGPRFLCRPRVRGPGFSR